jgi:histidinol-phosphate aminotransferase
MAATDRRRLLVGGLGGMGLFAGVGPLAASAAPALAGQGSADFGRLSFNENALGPSPRVAEAISANLDRLHRYVDQGEVDALGAQIAALERVDPEQVVIGEVLEPLGLQLAAARPGGGEFVFSTPGYTALIDASRPLGGVAVGVPLNARLENDLPALSAAITDRTLAVSLVNPHNPSGTVDDGAAFDHFVSDTAKRTLVVVDEAYLEYDDLDRRSAIRFTRAGDNVLTFRTLAKAYGLAGLSTGYAVAPLPLARRLKAAGLGAPHAQNRLALTAASAALADQDHLRAVALGVRRNRDRLHAALDRLSLPHTDSRASFVLFQSRLPAQGVRDALAARGLVVGRAFPPLGDWIRITIGTTAETDAVIAALDTLYAGDPS